VLIIIDSYYRYLLANLVRPKTVDKKKKAKHSRRFCICQITVIRRRPAQPLEALNLIIFGDCDLGVLISLPASLYISQNVKAITLYASCYQHWNATPFL